MEEVLHNTYLLSEIFEYVKEGRQLFKLAQTCKNFSEPAQDAIWRELDTDLFQLVRLLSNIRTRGVEGAQGKKINTLLDGDIVPEDIEKLLKFGRRVRRISFNRSTRHRKSLGNITDEVYGAIRSALAGRVLLPAVWELCVSIEGIPTSPSSNLMPLLLSPYTANISIIDGRFEMLEDTSVAEAQIHYVADLIEDPSRIATMEVLSNVIPARQSLVDTVLTFRGLRKLLLNLEKLPPTRFSFFQSLSQMKGLTQLSLEGVTFVITEEDRRSKLRFPVLEHFRIGCPLSNVLDILSITQFPSLTTFSHDFILPIMGQPIADAIWNHFFTALCNVTNPEAMKGITLSPISSLPSPHGSVQIKHFMATQRGVSFKSITDILFRFKNLTNFSPNFPLFRSLQPEDVKQMGQVWPELDSLALQCSTKHPMHHSILKTIAVRFQNLTDLTIAIGFDYFISRPVSKPEHQNGLKYLYVRMVGLDVDGNGFGAHDFAVLVDSLFPHLTYYADPDDGPEEGENPVAGALYALNELRKLERERLGVEDKEWKRLVTDDDVIDVLDDWEYARWEEGFSDSDED